MTASRKAPAPSNLTALSIKYSQLVRDRSLHVSPDGLLHHIAESARELPNCCVFVRQKKFFRDNHEFNRQLDFMLLNYLSFKIQDRNLIRFHNLSECDETYSQERHRTQIEDPNVIVTSAAPLNVKSRKNIEQLIQVISLVYHAYVYDDIVTAAATKLARNLLVQNENYGPTELLEYLARTYAIEGISYFECAPSNGKKPHLSGVKDYGAKKATSFLMKIGGSIDFAFARRTTVDGITKLGKEIVHYVIIPVSENNWKAQYGDGIGRFVAIFRANKEVVDFLVRFVISGAKGSAKVDRGRMQIAALQELDRSKQDLINHIRIGGLRLPSERRAYIKYGLSKIAPLIYECTSAHSVTIRRFDPFSDSLTIVAETCYESGKYKAQQSGGISTANTNSINAQCFRECQPGAYLYIPSFRKNARIHSIDGLYNPRNSESEICFPIWKAGIPVGTLNVESPVSNVFGKDIAFLDSVARMIAELITIEVDAISPDAVAQLSQVNELAHGTLTGGSEFSESELKAIPSTVRKTIMEWAQFEKDFRKPIKMTINSNRTVDLRAVVIRIIRASLTPIGRIQFDINKCVVVNKGTLINDYEREHIEYILTTITSNAERHSGLMQDDFRVILISRGAFKYLIIKYKSLRRRVDAEVAKVFGVLPVIKDDGVRYGAFLLGSRVRALGGIMEVKRPTANERELPLELSIALPMRRL